MAIFTLGKDERLKSRKQLQTLFKEGRSFVQPPFRVYYMPAENTGNSFPLKFGVGVSAKNFKRATDRNRIKRLIRESWRLQKYEMQSLLQQHGQFWNVFFIYTGKDICQFQDAQQATAAAIQRLVKIMEKQVS